MYHPINRIKFLFSLLTIIFFLGCTQKGKEDSKSGTDNAQIFKQTPINWIGTWQNRESKKGLVYSAMREFEIQHQNIKINLKYQEEFCGECKDVRIIMQDTIINIIKNDNYSWDIIPLTAKYYSNIADLLNDKEWGEKYLVNFEEFDWFRESHIPQVFEVSQYREDFGGIFAGPLIEGRYYGLWYNTETAKKLGITIKTTGMTFDDFLGYCKAVYNYNKTTTKKITFFSSLKVSEQITDIFNSLVLSEIGPMDNNLPDRKIALAAIRKTLNALEELAKYNAIDTSVKADKDFIYSLDGTVLFSVEPSSWYNQCESEDKEQAQNLVPAELPVFNKSGGLYRGSFQSVWAVFKKSPHRDQAIELLKFLCSNDVAERWLSTTYNPTGLKVKLKASDFGQNEIEKFNTYIERKYGKNIRNFDLALLLFGKKATIDPTNVFKGSVSAEEFLRKNVSHL